MGPRSRSRSRSYSPEDRRGRRRSYSRDRYSSPVSKRRQPPSPPPLPPSRRRSYSRSESPGYNRRNYSSHGNRSKPPRSRSPYDRNYRNNREKPSPCRCLGVFGLSVHTTQQQIREIFSKYGPIERIQVVVDAQTGRSRGFCFIYYKHLADAEVARDQCCGQEVDGRRIRVAYSITERPHSPTPGVYRGRSTRSLSQRNRSQRCHSPSPYSRSNRDRYERSRSRSHSPRRYRY